MRIVLTKGMGPDGQLRCEREDGSVYACTLPPNCAYHDLPHYVVERALEVKDGLWGTIASGYRMEDYALADADRPFPISEAAYHAELLATLLQSAVPTGLLSPEFHDFLRGKYLAAGLPFPSLPAVEVWNAWVAEGQALTKVWEGLVPGEWMELAF